jgi:DNA replication protein DnaC
MTTLSIVRSPSLNNLPSRKIQDALLAIENSSEDLATKAIKKTVIHRYAEANIPTAYWTLKMEKDFHGDPRLLNKYQEYITDLKVSYQEGKSICLAGKHGVGKSLTLICILKKATIKGYSTLYTTLSDIVGALTQGQDKYNAKQELIGVDFLAIDEVDGRFFSTDQAADLYCRSLEIVFRSRAQNQLPTLIATNSPNVVESFNGSLKDSMSSLMQGYMEELSVVGQDFRKKVK